MKVSFFVLVALALIACVYAAGLGDKSLTQSLSARSADLCALPPDPGYACEESLPSTRYRFNTKEHRCVSFQFKGCGGNSNNFDSLVECRKTCEED